MSAKRIGFDIAKKVSSKTFAKENFKTSKTNFKTLEIGKGVHQGCILSPCLFNLYAEYIMRTLDWKKHKLESRLPGEISITSDMQMTSPLWQKVKRTSKTSNF